MISVRGKRENRSVKRGALRSLGFTLIELMIVIAIVSILVAFAVPAYQDYTIRAKVTECIGISAVPKISIAEFRQTVGRWPADTIEAGVITGAFPTATVTVSKFCRVYYYNSNRGDFAIWANAGEIDSNLTGKRIIPVFSPTINFSGGSDWKCTFGFTDADMIKYLPSSCRGPNVFGIGPPP
ncbi:MAG: type IV pilus assembly protein PilA [Rhodothermales bacterium]|jgi:type IV pilus assembly protein PilA